MKKDSKSGKVRTLLFILLAAVVALAVYFLSAAKDEAESDMLFTMSTNAERVEFLNKQGWIVSPDPVSKETITIPSEFNDVYGKYAELLTSQGFDLEKFKGREAELISYRVLNYPEHPDNVTANLIIVDDKLIGGDITLNEENGFTEPIIAETAQTLVRTSIPYNEATMSEPQ